MSTTSPDQPEKINTELDQSQLEKTNPETPELETPKLEQQETKPQVVNPETPLELARCKSCDYPLPIDAKYCSNCSSKIVNERITLGGTFREFLTPMFSWDNNFFKTYKDIFVNPKDVMLAYISGARKKYFQPFSYLILYATIAVIFVKIFPEFDSEQAFADFNEGIEASTRDASSESEKSGAAMGATIKETVEKMMDYYYSYYNFIIILLIPVYSLLSYVVFRKWKNNFAEHLVFNSYLHTNIGLTQLVLNLVLIQVFGAGVVLYSALSAVLSYLLPILVFQQLYSLNFKNIVKATIKYFLLALILFSVPVVLVTLILALFLVKANA